MGTRAGSAIVQHARVLMTDRFVPFNRVALMGNESTYVAQAVASGHIAGNGEFTKTCQSILQRALGCPHALLTTSCTHALEMAAMLLDLRSGDEVIVPSFTFVSTANAFARQGAVPVFADIRPDTLNLDERCVERLISDRTRAIVAVHYAGVACRMDDLLALSEEHDFRIIEDNAHGLFGTFRGKLLGTFGALATQSFHETKNVTCGEGGALLINDQRYAARAEILRDKGTDRGRFFRGQVDKYTWVDTGSSYLTSELCAAFLCGQLERREHIQSARQRLWDRYERELRDSAKVRGWRMPVVPTDSHHPYHLFYMLLPSLRERQALIEHLSRRGVMAVFHYTPLHLSQMGRRFGGKPGECPVAERVSDCLVRLPLFNDMTEEEQDHIIAATLEFAF
jgi:dTDP-4-amino-4,6-dideoxygalactose transaminase